MISKSNGNTDQKTPNKQKMVLQQKTIYTGALCRAGLAQDRATSELLIGCLPNAGAAAETAVNIPNPHYTPKTSSSPSPLH